MAKKGQNELRLIRTLLTGSLLCSTVLVFALMAARTSLAWVFLGMLLTVFLLWFLSAYLFKKGKRVDWLLTIAVINFFIVVPELALRLADFHYESGIQFGYPRPSDFASFELDEKLFWKMKSSNPHINSMGFPGKEIAVPKPANTYRMLFMGDSVPFQGHTKMVEYFVRTRFPESPYKFESITMAVPGYSSHQGRVLTEMYGSKLQPDVVFVQFGWNDHWQAYGSPDSEKVVKISESPLSDIMRFAYDKLRLLQFLNSLVHSFKNYDMRLMEVRVPAEQYRANLLQIKKRFESENIPVVFITAPTSHYRRGVPDYLIELGFAQDKESVLSRHRKYNEIVREVAKTNGAYLVDLEKEFNLLSSDNLQTFFLEDGIHLTLYGMVTVAKRIAEFMETEPSLLAPITHAKAYHLSGSR